MRGSSGKQRSLLAKKPSVEIISVMQVATVTGYTAKMEDDGTFTLTIQINGLYEKDALMNVLDMQDYDEWERIEIRAIPEEFPDD